MSDDEESTLRALASGGEFTATFARISTIMNTFRYHGYVDEDDSLTARGRHAAELLPAIVVMELPTIDIAEPIETDQTETEDWD